MTQREIDRIESAIRHIQTSTDIDPWAAEIAVAAMRKQIADFGKKVERAAETAQNMQDEDLISRQDAIDAIEQLAISEDMCVFEILSHIELAIGTLPSAQPERKKGKWIPFDIPWYRCSECGAVRENIVFMENFCPNCGADMRPKEGDA